MIRKSTSAAPVTIIALSTTSDTSVILTTETPKDSTRSLESPEELTTLSEKSVEQSEVVTEDSLKSDFSVTEAFSTSETTIPNESSSTNEASTFSSSLTEPSSTQFVVNPNISIQEVFTESSPDVPVTTEEEVPSTTSATIPALNPVAPTEFEKLLSTLRDFVAKIDQFTTAAPQSSALTENVQKSVEYVNYTVSSGSEKVDAVKSISKRSVPDADLNPRYFKQHYSSNKDKGCIFNGRNFKLGEPIKTDNGCLKCICEYAPIGHCMLKEKCDF